MLHAPEKESASHDRHDWTMHALLRVGLGALCGLAILFGTIRPAKAQTTHSVTLSWTDALNPAGATYSVYRATGLCSGTPTFSKIASGVTAKTYQDTTVTPGNYCFAVTATVSGVESADSNSVNPAVPAFAPTGLSFTVQ